MDVATLGVAASLLSELKKAMDSAISSGDLVATNLLRKLSIEAEDILKQIETIKNGGFTELRKTEADVFRRVHDLVRNTWTNVHNEHRLAFINVNDTLVNISRQMDAIPFLNVNPYVFASEPLRLRSDSVDRQVFVYGYFPDVTDPRKATAEIAGRTVILNRFVGNRLAFTIPSDIKLMAGQYLEYTVKIPEMRLKDLPDWLTSNLDFLVDHTAIRDRIWVETDKPHSITIEYKTDNPARYELIKANKEFHASANDRHVSNSQTLKPQDLFSLLVANPNEYELESLTFADMKWRTGGGGPCEHASWSAKFTGWTPDRVSFVLSASSVGGHFHSAFDFRGGGGSNADIWLDPIFRAVRKGVDPTISSRKQIVLERNEVHYEDAPKDWVQVVITTTYHDGDEKWQQSITLDRKTPIGVQYFWNAQVDEHDRLTIETH
jgi:hypothetical protein